MWGQAFVRENLLKLKSLGVEFVEPRAEEDKAKIAETEDVVLAVERLLGLKTLAGKKVIVTSGATKETIDPIRVLTNRASGRTGKEIALQAYRLGAEVTIVHDGTMPPGIRSRRVESAAEMREAVLEEMAERGCDVFVAAAAVGDFEVGARQEKMKSDREATLTLKPAPKIVEEVRKRFPDVFVVGFKAETHKSDAELEKAAVELLGKGCGLVVANDVGKIPMGGKANRVLVVGAGAKPVVFDGPKARIAERLWEAVKAAWNPN